MHSVVCCRRTLLMHSQSWPKAHRGFRGSERRLTRELRTNPCGSAPSSLQRIGLASASLQPLPQFLCQSPALFNPHLWIRQLHSTQLDFPPSREWAIHLCIVGYLPTMQKVQFYDWLIDKYWVYSAVNDRTSDCNLTVDFKWSILNALSEKQQVHPVEIQL